MKDMTEQAPQARLYVYGRMVGGAFAFGYPSEASGTWRVL
jgi:hypothetical protein